MVWGKLMEEQLQKRNEEIAAQSSASTERWWPRTDTRAEWGAPPRPETVQQSLQKQMVQEEPEPAPIKKEEEISEEDTCEIKHSTRKLYYTTNVPRDLGVLLKKNNAMLIPTSNRPFKMFVNGGIEQFDLLSEHCKDVLTFENEEKKPESRHMLHRTTETVIEKAENGYEVRTMQTFRFPKSANITFYIATNTENYTDLPASDESV